MTIVEIFKKMRAACPHPCKLEILELPEMRGIEFRWRFKKNGRDYGYSKSISLYEFQFEHDRDGLLNFTFECAASEISRIGKEEAMLAEGQG